MKIAPEHTEEKILKLMGKPDKKTLLNFKALNKKSEKNSS
jgi:hypothetical protein